MLFTQICLAFINFVKIGCVNHALHKGVNLNLRVMFTFIAHQRQNPYYVRNTHKMLLRISVFHSYRRREGRTFRMSVDEGTFTRV